ncbi:MAG: phospholipase D-like domain-containing protein [Polyangiaceae bacterium]|jgi:cardiolipin synthase A/B
MPRSLIALLLTSLSVAACSGTSAAPPKGTGTLPDSGTSTSTDAGSEADSASDEDAGTYPYLIIEPDQGMTPIYNLISTAKKTLDMTIYELTDTTITGLLTTAAANGVTVRVILDQNLEMTSNTTAYNTLGAANVQVHWANPIYASTHQKTITVDGTVSAIMTLNLTPDEYKTSRDFAVITEDAADVAAIETTFAADFVNASITPPTGDDLVWSPTNAGPSLLGIINGAKATLLVENEEMGDDAIVSALSNAAGRGVSVEVAMEDSSDYQTEFTTLVQSGVKLSTYAHDAIYIHAKVILADYGTSTARVFIGSENFSSTSINYNRELGLITSNQAIMDGISTTLTSDFKGGTPYVPAPDAGPPADASATDAGATDAGATDSGAADAAED